MGFIMGHLRSQPIPSMDFTALLDGVLERANRVGLLCELALRTPGSARRCQEYLLFLWKRVEFASAAAAALRKETGHVIKWASLGLRALMDALQGVESLVGQCALPCCNHSTDLAAGLTWSSDSSLREAFGRLLLELQVCWRRLVPLTAGRWPLIEPSHVRVLGQLGRGSFGDVMAGDFLGVACAVKRLPVHAAGSVQRVMQLEDEAGLHLRLDHPNVVRAFGVTLCCGLTSELHGQGDNKECRGRLPPASSATENHRIHEINTAPKRHIAEPDPLERGTLALVLERMETNLWDALRGFVGKLNLRDRVRVGLGVARGLAYLHEEALPTVLHRDLKSPNVLIARDGTPRLGDFGSAVAMSSSPRGGGWRRKNGKDGRGRRSGPRGTPAWQAPEVLSGEVYTDRADVFSLGVVIWELVTLLDPCTVWGSNAVAVIAIKSGSRLPLPQGGCPITRSIGEVISACWHQCPTQRPSSAQVVCRIEGLLEGLRPGTPKTSSQSEIGDGRSRRSRPSGPAIFKFGAVAAAAVAGKMIAHRGASHDWGNLVRN